MIAYTLGPGYTKKGKAYWDKQNKVGPSFWTRILGTNKQAPADTFPGLGELPEMPGLPGLEELPEMPALPPLP
jgi:hypothetical protein